MTRFTEALLWAAKAHDGQKYGTFSWGEEEPYIMHPIRVSMRVGSESEKIVALLHDVLEDSDIGLPVSLLTEEEIDAVRDLTRQKEYETYDQYIDRIATKSSMLARKVKIADLKENISHLPQAQVLEGKAQDLWDKYSKALPVLRESLNRVV